MLQPLHAFSDWLSSTPLSLLIQTTSWAIPAVQTVHILAIAVAISAMALIHLRVIGISMRSQSTAAVANRFLPWIWYALIVLLVSGAVLIVAEPARSLPNGMFQLKMAMLAVAIALTVLLQRPLRRNPGYWDATAARRINATAIAALSLILWACIVFAGRWIAYYGG